MHDLDMKRRQRSRPSSRHEQRRRGERLNWLILLFVIALFGLAMVLHDRQRAVDPSDRHSRSMLHDR